ncbi:MAG: sensor domain-containing protein [Actinobacteria bacterium]|nr:sensor domain-containing protein [Actinomycetota bacterium]MBI3686881.1 sensor domain-containing protein [Actinomycetota bacterium]
MKALRHPTRRLVDSAETRAEAYLLLGGAFGVLWFTLIGTLYLSGLLTKVLLVGLPVFAGAHMLLRPIGRFERFLVKSLLGQDVTTPEPLRYERSAGSRISGLVDVSRRGYAVLQDGHSWRVLVWTLGRFVLGPLGLVVVVVYVILPMLLVAAPLAVVVDAVSEDVSIDFAGKSWLLLCPVGLVVLVPLRAAIRGLTTLHRRFAGWALGPGRREIAAAALARAAQAEEQVRIDQELHDSIGHMLSMIVVQAGAGAHVFDQDPDFARQALGTIERRGRAALGELDRIISGIRDHNSDKAAGAAGTGGHAPLPGGGDLPTLVAGAREAGMDVTSRIRIGELPPALGRGVYRIVQEALTNAAKHAPGRAVAVDVAMGEEAVAVSVVNEFHGSTWPGSATPGHGLAFMRDRAALLGGEVSVGETRSGGFAVRAVLPLTTMLPNGRSTRCSFSPRCDCLGCTIRRSVLG